LTGVNAREVLRAYRATGGGGDLGGSRRPARRGRPRQRRKGVDLRQFARVPALGVGLSVFVLGTLWRLIGILALPRLRDRSPAREGAASPAAGALHAIVRGMWPRQAFMATTRFATLNGYAFHVGLALIFFGYAPHIAFVRRITGATWPALADAVMYVAAGVTIASLLMALMWRLSEPVRRTISNADDLISWTVTFLPVLTGMAATAEPSAAILGRDQVVYATPLALHLLSAELLLIWFPFGKLMHAVLFAFSRGATGVRFSHRGVEL
jgi:nitrate reductase gamma subunit